MRRSIVTLAALASIAVASPLLTGCGKSGGGGTPTTPGTSLTLAFTFPAQGASRLHTFTEAGVFDYRCIPHGGSGMTGRVTVDAGSANDSVVVNVGQGGLFFVPSSVTIKVGGYVRWVNASTMTNHTVTYP